MNICVAFPIKLAEAINTIRTGGSTGNELVSYLMNSTKTLSIKSSDKDRAFISGKSINWNSEDIKGGLDENGSDNRLQYIGLAHEMAHIEDMWKGTFDNTLWTVTKGGRHIPNSEKYATHIENLIRIEHGLPLRKYFMKYNLNGILIGGENTRLIENDSSLFYHNHYRNE